MKKLIAMALFCMFFCCGCISSKDIENNLSQVRLTKGEEFTDGKTEEERAQDIKDVLLFQIEELKGVAVVVESHTALIGLRLKEGNSEHEVEIKEEVTALIKEKDQTILGVSVTTNERITGMIENMERQRQRKTDNDGTR